MTIEELFGTLQMSVVSGWRKHLRTAKYAKHEALDEFYKEMPEKVDALIEAWMGAHGKKVGSFQNILSSSNMNTLKYLGELKRVCKEGYNLINDNDELKSLLDDIVNLINSTLYKVKELAESKSFKSLAEYVNESLVNESVKTYTLYFEREDLNPEELQSELDNTGFFEYCEVDFDSCDENTCQVRVTCSSPDLKKASKNIEGLAGWEEE
jgi:DNA-binding ferritin-like protein